jgi:transglutaminase-like putative cysteine protease
MSRTGWTVLVAGLLVVASVCSALGRRYVLGDDIDGPRAAGSWRVSLVASGVLSQADPGVNVSLPPDFRHQHIFDENFSSAQLSWRAGKEKESGRREAIFRRINLARAEPFRVTYTFGVLTGVRKPTAAMTALTREIDDAPGPACLTPGPHIESDDDEIRNCAVDVLRQVPQFLERPDEPLDSADAVNALYTFVSRLPNEPTLATLGALDCLRDKGGDSGGKSRLLVALCRQHRIPARLISGLILVGGQDISLHFWVEAWVKDRWLPMCPTHHHFGAEKLPGNYVVLHIGDDALVRSKANLQFGFVVQDLHKADLGDDAPHTRLREILQAVSLYNLKPAEQRLAKFLLLLPLAALIVSVIRTIIGVPTFGTFSPALLGLAFLDLKGLPWGLAIFVGIVLCGWLMRRMLEGFHLLQVPRTSALLTLIVGLLLVVVVWAGHSNIPATQYISLFPLVILTHLVERFWTIEAEDGTVSSFRTLAGTMGVAASISLLLAPAFVAGWMFRYPETLGFVLALQFLLGRYTGYRLTELYRFGDLLALEVDAVPGPTPASTPSTNGHGVAHHEPAAADARIQRSPG